MGRKRARSDASEVFKKKSKPGLQNRKLFAKILSALHALKIFVFYFCIPFTIALLLALFFTSPRPKLSNELADWRDSGYTYEYEGFEIFYQGNVYVFLTTDMNIPPISSLCNLHLNEQMQ